MLNRSKLLKEIESISDKLFFDNGHLIKKARDLWQEILEDKDIHNKIKKNKNYFLLPDWAENLSSVYKSNNIENYSILSSDGSQIYPDRHQSIACYLINIGLVYFNYNNTSFVNFDSIPFLFTLITESDAVDLVDCKRHELEFKLALEKILEYKNNKTSCDLFLFDGSLIFWHLEKKSEDLKKIYLERYFNLLNSFYETNILIAGYISFAKSKELVNIIRARLIFDKQEHNWLENFVDTQIASFYLPTYTRTIIFKNNSPITQEYPKHLHPYFFYLNIGPEIARIEIPQYIAQDIERVNLICDIIIDQSKKGFGYPVSLSNAHEQAVVKSPDRDFFYQMLYKLSIDNNRQYLESQKNLKKRFTTY